MHNLFPLTKSYLFITNIVMKVNYTLLCGGVGSRLWPMSTHEKPKQFHSLLSNNCILEETLLRIPKNSQVTLVSNIKYKDKMQMIVDKHKHQYNIHAIYEPCSKNTSPAILMAAIHNLNRGNEVMVVLPSDHYVDIKEFNKSIEKGSNCCLKY